MLYACHVEAISDKQPFIFTNELITLQTMITIWIGDHSGQCKIGRLKWVDIRVADVIKLHLDGEEYQMQIMALYSIMIK